MKNDEFRAESAGKRRPLHEIINLWGVGILVAGLVGAVLIYLFAGDDRDADAAREIASGRMYEHNLEMIGGKLNVYLVRFSEWFASIWHGTSLAVTVGVLSVVIALACFGIAHLIATTPPESSGQDRQP